MCGINKPPQKKNFKPLLIRLLAPQATEPSPKAVGDSLAGRVSLAGIVAGGVGRGHGRRGHAAAGARHVVANAALADLGPVVLVASIGSRKQLIASAGGALRGTMLLEASLLLLVVPLDGERWFAFSLEVILMIGL